MNTVEDFKNAPTGATATLSDGLRAMKTGYVEPLWVAQNGFFMSNEQVAGRGYTLDLPAPESAREALDLAWILAYEVKEGRVIPEGTRYLEMHGDELKLFTARVDFTSRSPELAAMIRTLEPLPGTGPYWLDAPAVLAATSMCPDQKIWVPLSGGVWKCSCCRDELHWYELVSVDPLYSRGQEEAQS